MRRKRRNTALTNPFAGCHCARASAACTVWSTTVYGAYVGCSASLSNANAQASRLSSALFSGLPGVASRSPYELAAGSSPSLRDGDLLPPHRSPYCLRARSLGNLTEKCASGGGAQRPAGQVLKRAARGGRVNPREYSCERGG